MVDPAPPDWVGEFSCVLLILRCSGRGPILIARHRKPRAARVGIISTLERLLTCTRMLRTMAPQSMNKILDARGGGSVPELGRSLAHRRVPVWIWLLCVLLFVLVLGLLGYQYLSRRPVSADALWQEAQQEFQAGRYDRVELALGRLRRLRKPTPLDRLLQAQLAYARNQPDRALAELAQVPDDHYMSACARLMAGQIELRRDRVRYAEESFRAALLIDPGLVQAHSELIYILGMQLRRAELSAQFLALSKLTELTFDNVFHWCLLRNNSWEAREMVEILGRYIAADPSDRSSRVALAENYRRMNLYDEMETVLSAPAAGGFRGDRNPSPGCSGPPASG